MLAMKRLELIINQLQTQKVVLVNELSKQLAVTEETIRRDLEKLEKQNVLRRVHGGAYLVEGYGNETPVSVREQIYLAEKATIAHQCMGLVQDNNSLMLDCSTTAKYIAQALVSSQKKATVITHSLLVAGEVAKSPKLRLIMLGGEFNADLNAFFGEVTVRSLEGYYADIAFISAAGISAKAGITDYTQEEAAVRRAMIHRSSSCCFAGDTSKLGRIAVHAVAELASIGFVVTDQPFTAKDKPLMAALARQKTQLFTSTPAQPSP